MKWWQEAVFYQIYPRSFADGNGDGIGDLAGLTAKLDYLKDLGVGALWLSPHYPSPQKDCGYDVSDYCGVAPEYGTLDDFRAFLAAAHGRGIKVILDFVLNHSSDRHPWFLESASSRDNPKADWYVWKDPRPGAGEPGSPEAAPNDWQSFFDGPAWTWVESRKQYYYHIFMKEQPDLNWRNPELREAIYGAMRFWLDLGVDGFRLDAVGTLFENPSYEPQGTGHTLKSQRLLDRRARTPWKKAAAGKIWGRMYRHQLGQEGIHEVFRELRSLVDSYPGDRVLIGEDDQVAFLGKGDDELHLVFNFPLMNEPRLCPRTILANQRKRLAALEALPVPGWPCNTLGNHDSSRSLSRRGRGPEALPRARLNAALLMTLRGTPVLYNGEEIGMSDHLIGEVSALRDVTATWHYDTLVRDFGVDPREAAREAAERSRDRCRTPLQWGPGPNADFCPAGTAPWLPVNPDYASGVNVADEERKPDSLLWLYRRLGSLRLALEPLRAGKWEALPQRGGSVLAFLRDSGGKRALVALNYSGRPRPLRLPAGQSGRIALAEGWRDEGHAQAPSPRRGESPLSTGSPLPLRPELPPWGILVAELD